jgi:hypothetical protein
VVPWASGWGSSGLEPIIVYGAARRLATKPGRSQLQRFDVPRRFARCVGADHLESGKRSNHRRKQSIHSACSTEHSRLWGRLSSLARSRGLLPTRRVSLHSVRSTRSRRTALTPPS